jgi:hypothetical protein
MTKIVVTFGLIAGAIMAAMMFLTLPFQEQIGFDKGLIVGYTSMVLAFLMIYFGVRSYRDNVTGGQLTFGRAFAVGVMITLVATVCYVAAWEVIYHNFMPDFVDKYAAQVIAEAKAAGASEAKIAEQVKQMNDFKEMYKNPFYNVAMTAIEPLPVGLVLALVTAGVLRRKPA